MRNFASVEGSSLIKRAVTPSAVISAISAEKRRPSRNNSAASPGCIRSTRDA